MIGVRDCNVSGVYVQGDQPRAAAGGNKDCTTKKSIKAKTKEDAHGTATCTTLPTAPIGHMDRAKRSALETGSATATPTKKGGIRSSLHISLK